MSYKLSYKPFGEDAILIEWPQVIDKLVLNDLLSFKEELISEKIKHIIEIKCAYNSILVFYENNLSSFEDKVAILKSIYNNTKLSISVKSRKWKIPVCYEAEFALDLEALAESKNITNQEVVKRHSEAIYTVYFIGFLPGFLYLGGLDETLITPRKASPRLNVQKGSVAIGGNQTGIYPSESPGGWHIIGNSPIDFFNLKNESPCFAKAGDSIQFYEVDLNEYRTIKSLVDANAYELESEVIYD